MEDIFIELENKLKTLCLDLENDLKNKIQTEHYGTGELYDSIHVQIIKQNTENYTIRITTDYWLKYLEEGEFLREWRQDNKKKIEQVIGMAAKRDILNMFKKINKEK